MKRFKFPCPIKPWIVTREWGVYDPIYAQFGFKFHNGTDVALESDKLVRAPFAGTIIRAGTKENGQWQPNGGGIYCGLLSDEEYLFDDSKTAFVLMDELHDEKLLVSEGQHVIAGQPLAIGDNTGASTGNHTHFQLRRETKIPAPVGASNSYRFLSDSFLLQDVDKNEMNNSFDPTPYYTGTYVIDDAVSGIQKILNSIMNILKSWKRS